MPHDVLMVFAESSAFGAEGDGESLKKNRFLSTTREVEDLNQYWYSNRSIDAMVRDVESVCAGDDTTCAFLSTPSVYFSLSKPVRARSWCFDLDEQWQNDRGFVRYDFNEPTSFPNHDQLKGTFDMVVIDPPFITREVWENYTETAKFLLKPGGGGDGIDDCRERAIHERVVGMRTANVPAVNPNARVPVQILHELQIQKFNCQESGNTGRRRLNVCG